MNFIFVLGLRSYSIDDVFSGSNYLPTEAILFLCTQKNALGELTSSILNFRQYSLQDATFYVDNEKFPNNDFNLMTDDDNDYGRLNGFNSLWSNDNIWADEGTFVDVGRYNRSMFFLKYNFGRRSSQYADSIQAPRLASARLTLNFATELTEPLRVYVMCKYFVELMLDSNRQVIRNYSL